MLYHFNNIEERENDFLTLSHRTGELNPIKYSFLNHSYSNEHKRRFEASFSDRFEALKENQKTIFQTVFPIKSTAILLTYLVIFVLYLYIGAFCFKTIELNKEKEDRSRFFKFRMGFLQNNSCVTDKELEIFIEHVQALGGRGVNALGNATVNNYNWDFGNAVFFATSLVTTIGYGNDKPVTMIGKIFCIAFVMFGIPMMMIMTTAVVERLFLLVDLSFSALCYRFHWRITEDKFREIQIKISFFLLLIFFFLIPALAFTKMEEPNWTLLDSVYFCVISLTTIGLGDLVPGEGSDLARRNLSRILATIYLFTGLLATSFCIRTFHRHQKWNMAEKYIYLSNEVQIRPFRTDSISISEDSSSPDSSDPIISFPPNRSYLIPKKKIKRVRYNSFS